MATKVHPENLAYEDVLATTRASLGRLGLETIDLLYVHWPIDAYDPEGTLGALNELQADGLVDRVGLSTFTPDLLEEALARLDGALFAHQIEFHPFLQQRELHRYASEHDHWLVGYCPLARGGVLDDPVIADIADGYGVSAARVTLAWATSKPNVAVVPKATGDHIEDNFAARELTLDDDEIARIDELDRNERFIDDTPGTPPWE